MDSQDLGHDRSDKASNVKDDANGQRSQGHRETREVDRTTIEQKYYSLSGTDQTSCGGTPVMIIRNYERELRISGPVI